MNAGPFFLPQFPSGSVNLDLSYLQAHEKPERALRKKIRERAHTGCRFQTGRDGNPITAVAIWTGKGRGRKEIKINLTRAQGEFLFHLPFPSADALPIGKIMKKAGVELSHFAEVLDLVQLLTDRGVIETVK